MHVRGKDDGYTGRRMSGKELSGQSKLGRTKRRCIDVMSEVDLMTSDDSSIKGIMSTHTHNVRSRTFHLDDPASDPFRWTYSVIMNGYI